MIIEKSSLGDLYDYIMRCAKLDEFKVANKSAALGELSFVEIDVPTREYVMPVIEKLDDAYREKARFMLDVSLLNLLRKSKDYDASKVIGVDVHYGTLIKTSFRTRYLVVLAEFIKNSKCNIFLDIKSVPMTVHPTRLCDLLRYLIPITKNVGIQVSEDNILSQDLTKISAKFFVLTVPDITDINVSLHRETSLERLSRLPKSNKEIIIRNVTEIVEKTDMAFYL